GGGRSGATSGGGGGGGGRRGGGGGRGGGGRGGGGGAGPARRGASAPIPRGYKIGVSPQNGIKGGDTENKNQELHMGGKSSGLQRQRRDESGRCGNHPESKKQLAERYQMPGRRR